MITQKFIIENLYKKSWISYLLYPLSLIYVFVIIFRRVIYHLFPYLTFYSTIKTISVGNITSGGTGKTPLTLYIAEFLIKKNKKIAIVLRGYKGLAENDNVEVNNLNLSDVGDEANIYYNNLPNIPIFVGKKRYISIKMIEDKYPETDYIIMDDALQHLKVFQDIKICIFNTREPLGNGFCLPAGILREPLFVVKYFDFVVFNGEETIFSKKFKSKIKKRIINGKKSFYKICDRNNFEVPIDLLKDKKLILFSGIGSPNSFEKLIISLDLTFTKHIIQNDHYNYTKNDIINLKNEDFDYIITTEKDFTKLNLLNQNINFLIVYIKFEVDNNSFLENIN
jgi:tetraacyldisaccharide 4'-kinase